MCKSSKNQTGTKKYQPLVHIPLAIEQAIEGFLQVKPKNKAHVK
jgi:hypothetical protein